VAVDYYNPALGAIDPLSREDVRNAVPIHADDWHLRRRHRAAWGNDLPQTIAEREASH
jgi:hypothetical protein